MVFIGICRLNAGAVRLVWSILACIATRMLKTDRVTIVHTNPHLKAHFTKTQFYSVPDWAVVAPSPYVRLLYQETILQNQ